MNSRQLKYAIELSRSLNFSLVSEQLGISQPALSKQILALENELGVKLFDRSSNPLKLTAAGEFFIARAKQLLLDEDMLIDSMAQYKSGNRGQIVIGSTPFRSQYLLAKAAREFIDFYPNVKIILKEQDSSQLRQDTIDGKYDFAIVNLPVDKSVLDVIPLEADTLVLVIQQELANKYLSPNIRNASVIKLSDCKNIPFVTLGKEQELRQLFDKQCAFENYTPNISMEVKGISTAYEMCVAGIGATLLPKQFMEYKGTNNGTYSFLLEHPLYTRCPAIVRRKGQYVSEYAKTFIDLLCRS